MNVKTFPHRNSSGQNLSLQKRSQTSLALVIQLNKVSRGHVQSVILNFIVRCTSKLWTYFIWIVFAHLNICALYLQNHLTEFQKIAQINPR